MVHWDALKSEKFRYLVLNSLTPTHTCQNFHMDFPKDLEDKGFYPPPSA